MVGTAAAVVVVAAVAGPLQHTTWLRSSRNRRTLRKGQDYRLLLPLLLGQGLEQALEQELSSVAPVEGCLGLGRILVAEIASNGRYIRHHVVSGSDFSLNLKSTWWKTQSHQGIKV